MKKYTLSELLNCTFDNYYKLGEETKGLNNSIIAKPKYRNFQLYAKPNIWKCDDAKDKSVDNAIHGHWDKYGPKVNEFIWFLTNLGVITPVDNCYHFNIESDGKTIDYPEYEIRDIEKWNYYYNLLKSNEFVQNLDIFSYCSESDDNGKRELYGCIDYINANRLKQSLNDEFNFWYDKDYQIQYRNPDIKKLTIDELEEFIHTFTFDDNYMSDYLKCLLDKNDGNDFDLISNLGNYKIDNEAKAISLKLIKR